MKRYRVAFLYDGNQNSSKSHDLYRLDFVDGVAVLTKVSTTLTPPYVSKHSQFLGVPLVLKQSLEDVLF